MNGKVIGALLAGLVIGGIVGYVVAPKPVPQPELGKVGLNGLNPPIQAYITLQGDGSCRQTVGPDQIDFPQVSRAEKQTVEWMGKSAVTAPQVSFPTAGVPFAQNSFSNEADSGAVTVATPLKMDYPYSSVSVVDPSGKYVPCNLNIHPMGVHVDN